MRWNRCSTCRPAARPLAREIRGGLATFLTMAYILFANPSILAGAGVPVESALAATALSAAVCSVLMGLVANMPLAMAPGMGLNAVVAFQLAVTHGLVAGGDGARRRRGPARPGAGDRRACARR